MGGNWSLGYEAKQGAFPSVPYPTLAGSPQAGIYVGGNVLASGVARVLRGNAYIGGTLTGSLDVQNGFGTFTGSGAVDPSVFTNQFAYSVAQSNALNSLAGVNVTVSDPNVLNLDLNANVLNGNTKVYNINAADLATNTAVNITGGNASTTVIMNVHGAAVANWGWQVNSSLTGSTIWNFTSQTNLTINRQLDGSILAPFTSVHQQLGNINGTLIAANWTNANSQELHTRLFQGNAPVPEPATMAVLGLGVAALIRKRKKAQEGLGLKD